MFLRSVVVTGVSALVAGTLFMPDKSGFLMGIKTDHLAPITRAKDFNVLHGTLLIIVFALIPAGNALGKHKL